MKGAWHGRLLRRRATARLVGRRATARLVGRRAEAQAPAADRDRRPPADPFLLLGLDPAADPTDDEVRAAWRRVAAATHPDRADGGDPARFAAAAAAYTELRTPFGRGEARAGREAARAGRSGPRLPPLATSGAAAAIAATIRGGRPARLMLRVLSCAAGIVVVILASWPRPAAFALMAGALTWLVLTGRRDLAAGSGQAGSGPVATGLAGSATHSDQDPT